jgi:hypothetical protein
MLRLKNVTRYFNKSDVEVGRFRGAQYPSGLLGYGYVWDFFISLWMLFERGRGNLRLSGNPAWFRERAITMTHSRSLVLASSLVLAVAAQPAAATTGLRALPASPHARASAPQLQASLGSHLLAVIRHILAGDDTIHRG